MPFRAEKGRKVIPSSAPRFPSLENISNEFIRSDEDGPGATRVKLGHEHLMRGCCSHADVRRGGAMSIARPRAARIATAPIRAAGTSCAPLGPPVAPQAPPSAPKAAPVAPQGPSGCRPSQGRYRHGRCVSIDTGPSVMPCHFGQVRDRYGHCVMPGAVLRCPPAPRQGCRTCHRAAPPEHADSWAEVVLRSICRISARTD